MISDTGSYHVPANAGDLPDDPRLMEAVQSYMTLMESGRHPSRTEFLSRYPDLAGPLEQCLDGLELVHKAALREKQTVGDAAGQAGETLPVDPLGDFKIVREIGRGGMGVVYEAVQMSLGRRVALKVLPFAATFDPRHLQRFKNEAQAAAQLHHSNIVPVYAVGADRGVHYYAMQLIDGQSLAVVIQQMRRQAGLFSAEERSSGSVVQLVPPVKKVEPETVSQVAMALSTQRTEKKRERFFRTAARFIVQAAEALEHAHQVGIVHRDIKPANLLVDATNRLWITDFGLAQFHADAGLTQTGDILGTLRYMSPEQASGQRVLVDHRTDIYSLGATLYELVTLEPIFPGRNRQELLNQIMQEEPRPPQAWDSTIPVDLETIILKAVSKNPADRYGSARELAADLQCYLEDKPILAKRPTMIDRARRWSRRHPSLVAGGVLLLLLCTVGLLVNNRMIADEEAKTAKRAEQAEARFQLARRAVNDMIHLADEEQSDNPFSQTLRRRLLESALAYYQEFIEQRRDDPGAQAELEATRKHVKDILADLVVMQGAWKYLLLANPRVQDELALSAEQRRRLAEVVGPANDRRTDPMPDFHRLNADERSRRLVVEARAREAAVTDILTPNQLRRLHQIALQARGVTAFREPDVIDSLKLTSEQKEKIRVIEGEMYVVRLEARRFGEPPPEPGRISREELVESAMKKVRAALTDEQLLRWKEMTGEPFKGPMLFLNSVRVRPAVPPGNR
jgi:serine/threonine protein kinase